MRADNRQKDMNLSRDYVTEWLTYIAEPLAIAFLCRASAIDASIIALGLASVSGNGRQAFYDVLSTAKSKSKLTQKTKVRKCYR